MNAEHRGTIKRILENALTAVRTGRQIPFGNDTDMAVIVGHFPELKAPIIEWDNQVDEATIREHQLTDRFDATMSTLSLGPPFSRRTFERFLEEAKKRARDQHLSYPYVIAWREDKTPFPACYDSRRLGRRSCRRESDGAHARGDPYEDTGVRQPSDELGPIT